MKGASSFPLAKAMDDCVVCYAMNGEALRPQQGFPLRLLIPGFEGIFNTKYLRRMKVVDRYYMNYDYGHLRPDPVSAALGYQIGPKSVITFPSAGQQLPGPGFYEVSGLAWSGGDAIRRVEVSTDGGRSWMDAELKGTAYRMGAALLRRMLSQSFIRSYAHGRPLTGALWPGTASGRHLHPLLSGPRPA